VAVHVDAQGALEHLEALVLLGVEVLRRGDPVGRVFGLDLEQLRLGADHRD